MSTTGPTEEVIMRRLRIPALTLLVALVTSLSGPTPVPAIEDETSPPNIVLIVSDDQAYRSFPWMPYLSSRPWTTFSNAFITNPLCCPSRATLLTGQYSHHTGVTTNTRAALFQDDNTLATWLDAAGYRTGLIGKYLNDYPWERGRHYRPPGWDRWVAFMRRPEYYGYRLNIDGRIKQFGSAPADYSTRVFTRQAERFLSQEGSPFFLYLTPYGPHGPAIPDERDRGHFRGQPVPLPPNINERSLDKPGWVRHLPAIQARELREDFRSRAAAGLSIDRLVKQVVTVLRRGDRLQHTVVIYMTDNGVALGAHRFDQKSCSYEECVRTPLSMRYPGGPSTVDSLVSNIDIAPTIAEIAGVTPTLPVDGASLVPSLEGNHQADRPILLRQASSAKGFPVPPFWGVRTTQYKYVEYETGERELYDLFADPYELHNHANQPEYAGIQADLAITLAGLAP